MLPRDLALGSFCVQIKVVNVVEISYNIKINTEIWSAKMG